MKFGVVVFPGSNCDADVIHVCKEVMQCETRILWHKDTHLQDLTTKDCIMIPGGFSYGDYLRCGAIARFSPMMQSVIDFANRGGKVLGVCNGFQILCESGLLPGVLLQNANQQFICKNVFITNPATGALKIPIAHGEGRFHADEATLNELEKNDQILFRYSDEWGNIVDQANPNGAARNIAGIRNKQNNVFGMMPYPERATNAALQNLDGLKVFELLSIQ